MAQTPWSRPRPPLSRCKRRYAQEAEVLDDEVVDLTALAATWTLNETPATKVFATYELLEQIFLSVLAFPSADALITILLAQRVDRNFKEVIERSERVQEKLFFKPADPAPCAAKQQEEDNESLHWADWNPLLTCWQMEPRRKQGNNKYSTRRRGYKADPFGINDFIQLNDRYFYISKAQTFWRYHGIPIQWGSWRRMLICQGDGFGKPLKIVASTRGSLHVNSRNKLVEGVTPRHIEILKPIEARDTLGGVMDMVRLRARGQSLTARGHTLSPEDVESVYNDWEGLSDDESDGGVSLAGYL